MSVEIDTLSKIKLTALKLFNERGYFETTTRDIASEVGIKSSSLYFYFKSKEEIFSTLHREARALFEKKTYSCLENPLDDDVSNQLYNLFCVSMDFFIENNEYSKFLFRYFIYEAHGVQQKAGTKLEDWVDIFSSYIIGLFNKGLQNKLFRKLTPDSLVKTFYRNLNGYIYELIAFNRVPSKDEVNEAWEIYWNGIKA